MGWYSSLTISAQLSFLSSDTRYTNGNFFWWKDWNSNTLATWCKELTPWKRHWCWEQLKAGGEGDNRGCDVKMVSRLNGREFEYTPGVADGQGGLACCSPWGLKEWDTTEWLKWTELMGRGYSFSGFDLKFLIWLIWHSYFFKSYFLKFPFHMILQFSAHTFSSAWGIGSPN